VESGRIELSFKSVPVQQIIESVVLSMKAQMEAKA